MTCSRQQRKAPRLRIEPGTSGTGASTTLPLAAPVPSTVCVCTHARARVCVSVCVCVSFSLFSLVACIYITAVVGFGP